MKSIYTIFIFLILSISLLAQDVSIYKIKTNGQRGKIDRKESFQNGLLIKVAQYDENNQLEFIKKKSYNDKKELIKEVKTFKQGHEYDLVTEYYYTSEGQKTGLLRGNNLTGQWYSERYIYNQNNDLDTIFYYQKNGDLTSILVHEYEYDDQNRPIKLTRINIDTEMEEETNRSVFQYEYNGANFDKKTTETDENGVVVYEEWQTNTSFGEPKTVIYKMSDLPTSKTVYSYFKNKKLSKKVEYSDGALSVTTTYRYNKSGKIAAKKMKTKNNYYGEIYVY